MGNPNPEHASTSVADRHNRSMCMSISRFKRDDVYQACFETLEAAWSEHDNRKALHSALGMQAPTEFYAE